MAPGQELRAKIQRTGEAFALRIRVPPAGARCFQIAGRRHWPYAPLQSVLCGQQAFLKDVLIKKAVAEPALFPL